MAMETDLVRTLKQIISLRSSSKPGLRIGGTSQSQDQSVTLFGKKLTLPKSEDNQEDDRAAVSEKLLPTAILHLKEHLKRKAARHNETVDALTTLPLLNGMQRDKESEVGLKRQRIGQDQFRMGVLSSKQAPTGFSAVASPGEVLAAGAPEFEIDVATTTAGPQSDDSRSAPLTMFYNGQVYVYEEIPADKAQAIMILAGSTSSNSSRSSSDVSGSGVAPPETRSSPEPPAKRSFTMADLPQARKASLQRFLEKRKERLVVFKSDKMIKKSSRLATPPKSLVEAPKVFNDFEAQERGAALVQSQ